MDFEPITNHDATDIPMSNPFTPFTTGEAFRMRAMISRRSPPPACSNSGSVDMGSRGSLLRKLRVVAGRLRSRSDAPADNAHRAPATNTRRTSPWTHRGGSGWPDHPPGWSDFRLSLASMDSRRTPNRRGGGETVRNDGPGLD